MKAGPIVTSFNGGELSPLMGGRVDMAKYAAGCSLMAGFIPIVEGPGVARPGTPFVAEVKTSSQRTWMMRFEFSEDDAYMIEVGHLYMRFYTMRGQVQSGGSPYEIVTPFTSASLTNEDGAFALRFAGSGDEIVIVHASYPPQLLTRHGATSWTIAPCVFDPPPFGSLNSSTTTVYASASTGAVNLVASAATFTADMVGQYFYLGERDVRDVQQWEPAKAVLLNDVLRSDGLNYKALNGGTTGTVKPTHTEGAAFDGKGGVQWQFLDPGYGWCKITTFTDSTHAAATVVSTLPTGCVTSGEPTTRWAKQAWNATDGYPVDVTFFRERQVFGGSSTAGAKLWFSVVEDFFNFAYEVAGQVTADSGFDRTIASDLQNDIRWMSAGDVLCLGTKGDEWAVQEANTQSAFGPANCKTARQSRYGSNRVRPATVAADTLFVQKAGRKVRAMSFNADFNGNLQSPDVTAFARHITTSGIVDMAFQQEPWGVLWAAREDGNLAALTLIREQNVVAWHQQPFQGGFVEALCSIPAPDGSRDDLWLIVRYTIAGVTRRYIAYLADPDTETTAAADWVYSDMALTYRGVPADTMSGLSHLEGKECWVLVDGAKHPNRTVAGGQISLQIPGSVVTVGLPSPAYLQPMNFEGGSANGTSQGKRVNASTITFRLYRTGSASAGRDLANLHPLVLRKPVDPMGNPVPTLTGDVEAEWDGDWAPNMPILFVKDGPTPATLLAIMPQFTVSEGR